MTKEVVVRIVTVEDINSHFDELLDLAEGGQEIIIIRDGREIARLRPPREQDAEDVPVPLRGFGQ